MQPDQIAVTITRQGTRVTARTSSPPGPEDTTEAPDREHGSARLDQLGLTSPAPSIALEPFNAADAVLHRAGFVAEVTHHGRVHHLPFGMTDPVEQRRAVTRAVDMLGSEGFAYAVEADLLDNSTPVPTDNEVNLGDRLAHLAHSLSQAGHTSQAVAVLSELTAPGDGVLDQVANILDATADWWEGLGEAADPLYADRLRRINQQMGVSFLEIKQLRSTLADRHTVHPRHAQPDTVSTQEPRVAAALAFSPSAQQSRPAPTPAHPAAPAVQPAARPERTR
ncbi:hypothetical protein [Actinacidiphila sp. bgisy144]|uniref:hypothetical protein n=1 Tax=Actinacidiphila sp. bgisy144 TaxID=3413791 RepID=UPI003EBE5459